MWTPGGWRRWDFAFVVGNIYDAMMASALIRALPDEVRYVLGNRHNNDEVGQVHTAAMGLAEAPLCRH